MWDLTSPAFTDEDKARDFLKLRAGRMVRFAAHCGQLETVKRLGGKSMGPGWYFCSDCRENSPLESARFTSVRISRCTNGWPLRI
jgi:hypothetical protein